MCGGGGCQENVQSEWVHRGLDGGGRGGIRRTAKVCPERNVQGVRRAVVYMYRGGHDGPFRPMGPSNIFLMFSWKGISSHLGP